VSGSPGPKPVVGTSESRVEAFDAESRGDWKEARQLYERAAVGSSDPWVALGLAARVSAQEGDIENARRLFDEATRELAGREGMAATTEVAPNARVGGLGGGAFAWLSPRRVAIATGRVVAVLGVDDDRVEYTAQTGYPFAEPIGVSDLVALTDRAPLLAIRHAQRGCVRVWNYARRRDVGCVEATFGDDDWLVLAPQGKVFWGHDASFFVAAGDRPAVRLATASVDASPAPAASSVDRCEIDTRPSFSPDGTLLAAGTRCGGISLWDVATGARRALVGASHARSVAALAWSFDGQRLAFASHEGRVSVVDRAGQVGATFVEPDPVDALAFSPDGQAIATVSTRGGTTTVTELSPIRERWRRTSAARAKKIAVEWSPEGRWVAVGDGAFVTLYAATDGATRALASEALGVPRSVRFDAGGGLVVQSDSESRFWGKDSPGTTRVTIDPAALALPAWSADGTRTARIREGGLDITDAKTGALVAAHPTAPAIGRDSTHAKNRDPAIEALLFAGSRVAAVFDNHARISIRDSSNGLEAVRIEAGPQAAETLVVDRAGKRLATGGNAGPVAVWDVESGRRISRRAAAQKPLRFSGDGLRLAVTEASGGRVVDAASGAPLEPLGALAPERVVDVAFSTRGEVLAAGPCVNRESQNAPREVCVWAADTGEEKLRARYETLYDYPVSAALSDDARWLALAQPGRGEVELWEIPSRNEKASLGSFGRTWLDGAYVRATNGRVDFAGRDRVKMESRMLCRLGETAVNFIACRERFLVPGLWSLVLNEP
jgi:WD40 repeat protein